VFVCPTRRAARAVADAGLNVWVYQYRYKEDWIEFPYIGDYHSSGRLLAYHAM